jgi:hypothetical protein
MLTFYLKYEERRQKMKIILLCLLLGVGIIGILIYAFGLKLRIKEISKEKGE